MKISPLKGHYDSVWSGAVRPYGLGPPIVFPVVGKATYSNTFASTPKGILPGNDIIAARKSLVVAAEKGTVAFVTRFKAAGCMLVLKGVSAPQGRKKLVLNLAEVPYIDSAGLGEIVRTYTTVSRQGGSLKLLSLTKRITDLLAITKLLTVFETYDHEADAVRSFSSANV